MSKKRVPHPIREMSDDGESYEDIYERLNKEEMMRLVKEKDKKIKSLEKIATKNPKTDNTKTALPGTTAVTNAYNKILLILDVHENFLNSWNGKDKPPKTLDIQKNLHEFFTQVLEQFEEQYKEYLGDTQALKNKVKEKRNTTKKRKVSEK